MPRQKIPQRSVGASPPHTAARRKPQASGPPGGFCPGLRLNPALTKMRLACRMPACLHRRRPGGTYFFTIRLADRNDDALVRRIAELRRAMRHRLKHHPFRIDAITVLPSVIHTIWTLPADSAGYPNRIGMLKARFSRALPMPPHLTPAQIARGEKGIWQRRFWEHEIRDSADFNRHRDLIYLAPVQAGLAAQPQDWPHCSLHRDLRRGMPAFAQIGQTAARMQFPPPEQEPLILTQ